MRTQATRSHLTDGVRRYSSEPALPSAVVSSSYFIYTLADRPEEPGAAVAPTGSSETLEWGRSLRQGREYALSQAGE